MAKTVRERLAEIDRASRFALADYEALGVVETTQGPMLPSQYRIRKANGELESRGCMLMLLDGPRRHKAKARARAWAAESKFDPTPNGPDQAVLDEMEEYERFAFIIRDEKAPHDQSYPNGSELFAAFKSVGTLAEVKGDYDVFEAINDPRYGELDEEQAWAVIRNVYREGTLRPLMHIGGLGQVSCILLSARAALSSPMAPLSVRFPWTFKSEKEGSKASESPSSSSSESSG